MPVNAAKKRIKMVWCVASYARNWQEDDILSRFINCARKVNAIGKVASINEYRQSEKKIVLTDNDDEAIEEIVNRLRHAKNNLDCSLSGDQPFHWELSLSYVFNPGPEEGIGRMFLEFFYELNAENSERLWHAFTEMHNLDDCSYAFIHPYNEWISVRDKKTPLVNCATFQTVLWANFIGSDQLKHFDRSKMLELQVHDTSGVELPWLRFRLLENVGDLVDKHRKNLMEKHRMSVDNKFRQALLK